MEGFLARIDRSHQREDIAIGSAKISLPGIVRLLSLALALRLRPYMKRWAIPSNVGGALAMAYRYTRYTHLYFIIWIRVKRERSIVAQNSLISSFGALNVPLSYALYKAGRNAPHKTFLKDDETLFLRTFSRETNSQRWERLCREWHHANLTFITYEIWSTLFMCTLKKISGEKATNGHFSQCIYHLFSKI